MGNFLDEDKDIIDRLNELSPGGPRSETSEEAFAQLQVKALLRTRKTFKDAGDRTDRFSWILLIFTITQVAIATFQFTLSIFSPKDDKSKVLVSAIFILFVSGLIWAGLKQMKKSFNKGEYL